MSNETASHCPLELFSTEPLFSTGELERHSEAAHGMIGVCLLALVLVWGGHVVKWPAPLSSLPAAYTAAGAIQCAGGLYLLLWVFVLLKPTQMGALWGFTQQALTQIQHISIACNLAACGVVDLAVAHGALVRLVGVSAHSLWALNLICVGLVFMVHPQSTSLADTEHVALGLCIIFGTHFLCNERRDGWLSKSIEALIGAPLFGVAAAILIAFEEKISPLKVLADPCQTGYRLAWVGGLVAAMSITVVSGLILWAAIRGETLGGEGHDTIASGHCRRHSQPTPPPWRRASGRYEMVPTEVEAE